MIGELEKSMEDADSILFKMAKVREAVEEDLEPSESEVEKSLSDDSGDEESLSSRDSDY